MFSGHDETLLFPIGDHIQSDFAPGTPPVLPTPGRLHHPWGVAVSPDGRLVAVTDSFNHCVQVFSSGDGRYVGTVGRGRGHAPGFFNRPAGIQYDGEGKLYVADSGNHRVQVRKGRGRGVLVSLLHAWLCCVGVLHMRVCFSGPNLCTPL